MYSINIILIFSLSFHEYKRQLLSILDYIINQKAKTLALSGFLWNFFFFLSDRPCGVIFPYKLEYPHRISLNLNVSSILFYCVLLQKLAIFCNLTNLLKKCWRFILQIFGKTIIYAQEASIFLHWVHDCAQRYSKLE